MKGFKGFNPGLVCRGKQYAENTVFEEEKADEIVKKVKDKEGVITEVEKEDASEEDWDWETLVDERTYLKMSDPYQREKYIRSLVEQVKTLLTLQLPAVYLPLFHLLRLWQVVGLPLLSVVLLVVGQLHSTPKLARQF